jgi:hypothetical protein
MSWVVVLDDDPVSREQREVCRALKPAQLQGAVLCSQPENKEICDAVDYFPAFCRGTECVYGLRVTEADFAKLDTMRSTAATPSAAPTPRTTPPAPTPPTQVPP